MGLNVYDAVRCHATGLTALELIVLRDYAHAANEETRISWPPVGRIAQNAQVEHRSAQRAIKRLVEKGYLVRMGRATGMRQDRAPVAYRIVVECNTRCREGRNGWIKHYPEGKPGVTYRPLRPGGIDDPDSDNFIALEKLSEATGNPPHPALPDAHGMTEQSPREDHPDMYEMTKESPREHYEVTGESPREHYEVTRQSPREGRPGIYEVTEQSPREHYGVTGESPREGHGVTHQALRGDSSVTQTTKEPLSSVDIPTSPRPGREKSRGRSETRADVNALGYAGGSPERDGVDQATSLREAITSLGGSGYLAAAEAKARATTPFLAVVQSAVSDIAKDSWQAFMPAQTCPVDEKLAGRFAARARTWITGLTADDPASRARAADIIAAGANAVWTAERACQAAEAKTGTRPPRARITSLADEAFKHLLDGADSADVDVAARAAAMQGQYRMDQLLVNIAHGGHSAVTTPAWESSPQAATVRGGSAEPGGVITRATRARDRRMARDAVQAAQLETTTTWELEN